jgi:hypothetical protein
MTLARGGGLVEGLAAVGVRLGGDAGGLDFGQELDGAVEDAIVAVLVAEEELSGLGLLLVGEGVLFEHLGFPALEAAKIPGGVEDLAEDLFLQLSMGLCGLTEAEFKCFEVVEFGLGDDEDLGGVSVDEAVHGGTGLAFLCARTGGGLRVLAVSVDLRFSSHGGRRTRGYRGFLGVLPQVVDNRQN